MLKRWIAWLLIIVMGLSLCACGDSEKTYQKTCKNCDRTFSYEGSEYGSLAQRNCKCISSTNMCINCYNNYCWAAGITPKEY